MPSSPAPIPPPRKNRLTGKDISKPIDCVHFLHVGPELKSEDVKNAIKKESLQQILSRTGHPNATSTSPKLTPTARDAPPDFDAPKYGLVDSNEDNRQSVSSEDYQCIGNWKPSEQQEKAKINYANLEPVHGYENIERKPFTKRTAPPPPPSQDVKPALSVVISPTSLNESDETPVMRTQRPNQPILELQKPIRTPQRIEMHTLSPEIERPNRLNGSGILGLNDSIPLRSISPSPLLSTRSSKSHNSMSNDMSTTSTSSSQGIFTPQKSAPKRVRAPLPPAFAQLANEAQQVVIARHSAEELQQSEYLKNENYKSKSESCMENEVPQEDRILPVIEETEDDKISERGREEPVPVIQNTIDAQVVKPVTSQVPPPIPKPRTRTSISTPVGDVPSRNDVQIEKLVIADTHENDEEEADITVLRL